MPTSSLASVHALRIAGFAIVLAIPIVYFLIGGDTAGPADKNRDAATLPKWTWTSTFIETAPQQYEAYFNDHLSLRFARTTTAAPVAEFHHFAPNLSVNVSGRPGRPRIRFTTNSEGIRGPEFTPKSARRILCIGSSTTQNLDLDDADTWPHLLMLNLNRDHADNYAWVGAIGLPGYATSHHLKYLKSGPSLNRYTDMVFLVGITDFLFWLAFDPERPRPQTAPTVTPPWRELTLYQWIAGDAQSTVGLIPDMTNLGVTLKARSQMKIVDDYPSPARVLSAFGQRIAEMIALCRELGVNPVFVVQPVLWDPNLPASLHDQLWMGRLKADDEYLSVSSLRELADTFAATLMKTCRDRGVTVVDASFMNGSPEYLFDDCHFTERGADVLAVRIAEALRGTEGNASTGGSVPENPLE